MDAFEQKMITSLFKENERISNNLKIISSKPENKDGTIKLSEIFDRFCDCVKNDLRGGAGGKESMLHAHMTSEILNSHDFLDYDNCHVSFVVAGKDNYNWVIDFFKPHSGNIYTFFNINGAEIDDLSKVSNFAAYLFVLNRERIGVEIDTEYEYKNI